MSSYELFHEVDGLHEVQPGLAMVVLLTGVTDAGNAVHQVQDFLLDTEEIKTLISFDNDELLDYRARRPVMEFDGQRVAEFVQGELSLFELKDDLGHPFLLLSGYEPDFKWNRFTDQLLEIIKELDVSSVTWLYAVPIPVPHTRPISTTVSGNREDLSDAFSVWKPHTNAPGTVLHLLEVKLAEEGIPAAGFILLVSHYLADSTYPVAAAKGVEMISAATQLILSPEKFLEEEATFLEKLDKQLEHNDELRQIIVKLEDRHDEFVANQESAKKHEETELPTADELADELEKFLASRRFGDQEK
ncbi:MAG: PAC2 family protein [Microbacteriaceae bacterium]|nr:PAC2 family protein [Microbacteriaceae bacterium]